MKKLFCLLLSVLMLSSVIVPFSVLAEGPSPVLEYTFEDAAERYTLYGQAEVVNDADRKSNVLSLNGTRGSYAAFPRGFFDGRDKMTITMDVKTNLKEGNFFTFAYGYNNQKYSFLRLRSCEALFSTTKESYNNDKPSSSLSIRAGIWSNIAIVIDDYNYYVYVNGIKQNEYIGTDVKTSDLGSNLFGYLGKSFYTDDMYFNGAFDNIKVYDQALTAEQIIDAVEDTVPLISSVVVGTLADRASQGTDDHTASNTIVNNDKKTITPYVRQTADLKALPVKISKLCDECTVLIDGEEFVNNATYDLTYDRTLTVSYKDRTDTFLLSKAQIAYNAVLPGQYADPDIDYINGKYWMFPTTDGSWWWGGTDFHAFSSDDLVNWKDEGVIIDLVNDNPGKNINGVQIASVSWANGNAWAPTVEEKNGKIYLYFCGRDIRPGVYPDDANGNPGSRMAIGVAVADNPAGPYKVIQEPIITSMIAEEGIPNYTSIDGIIDPAAFTDDDGTSYLLFGNTTPVIAKLSKDMLSVEVNSMAKLTGLTDFLESVYLTKVNGLYHFTWSCYGTNNEHYCVKYGTAKSIVPDKNGEVKVTYHYNLLDKEPAMGIVCTGHQSLLYQKDLNRCFIAYHRFCTPLEEYNEGYGFHRETCIDEVFFDSDGLMKVVIPTMSGTGRVTTKPCSDLTMSISASTYTYDGNAKKPAVTIKDKNGKTVSTSNYTVSYSNNVNVGDATVRVKFKNAYAGTLEKTFRIQPKVVLSKTSFVYNGKVQKPTVTVYDHNGKLTSYNYTLSWSNGLKNIGKYSVTVQMKGKYNDKITKTYTINPKIALSLASYTYDGKVKKPSVVVTDANGKKIATKYYTVSYASGRKYVGTYNVTVKFKGGHSGTYTKTFNINPPVTTISSLTAGSKKFTVKWAKKTAQTTGYQIQYSTNSKFSSAKTVTVSGNSNTSKAVTGLAAKKKYYVRIRTYKKINGTNYYSGWSKAKYVTTK